MKIHIHILNAFVDKNQGGNPAGVVLNADTLSNQQKLEIATKVGLSETAFVSQSNTADYKIDFFTPTKQIAHCGHATVATFSYLKQLGKISGNHSSKETIDGPRKIKFNGDLAFMEQASPMFNAIINPNEVLNSIGIKKSDSSLQNPISIVNTGNSFMIIQVNDESTLKSLSPNYKSISKISERYGLIGYYVFFVGDDKSDYDAQTRMFAPFYGIEEEAATGMAAGPLACYLYDKCGIKKANYTIKQGYYMNSPSPSLLHVSLDIENNKIQSLMAGGIGKLTATKELEI